jgi:hypothetical protein
MAEADEHVALVQLRATLSALSAAAQLETTTQREIFSAVSDAMGGATFNAATRAVMKAELEGFLVRLTQSQSGAPSGEAAVPAKRPRKAAQPQRRKKAASSGEDEESEPSAEASEGDEEASDSDFEETSGAHACIHAQSEALPLFCTAAHAGGAQRMTRASRGARRARRPLRPLRRRKRRRRRPRLPPKPRLRKAAHARRMQLQALPLLPQLPPSQPSALRRRLRPRRRPQLRAQRAQEGRQRPRSWRRVLLPCSPPRRRG